VKVGKNRVHREVHAEVASSLSVLGRPGALFTSRALANCTSSPAASSDYREPTGTNQE